MPTRRVQRPKPIAKRRLALSRVYRLLEPGPVVLLTTSAHGRPNVMAMSWHTPLEFEPPLIGCVISERNFSFAALRASRECVLNLPSAALAAQLVGCGNCSGRSVDKFARFGLTPVAAEQVDAPLIAECFASLECRVTDQRLVRDYNFFVLEVVQAWIGTPRERWRTLHHEGMGAFMVAGRQIRLPSKMK